MAMRTAELAPPEPHATTVELGRYELGAELAKTDWGSLWSGRSSQDGAGVVVRRIPRQVGLEQEQFDLVCEAAWLAIELRHPAIAAVLDVVITPDEVGVVSEQVGTRTLAQVLSEDRARGMAMPTLAALHIAFDVLAGIGAAHTLWAELGDSAEPFFGVLEPGSILIDARGYAKLIDIGLAGCIRAPTWQDPDSDSAQYRAPERRRTGARVDARADIFSVGVLLWEMLSNRRLSPAMLQAPPSAITGSLPRALGAIVARALDPDPRARYQSTEEMALAVRTVATGSRPPCSSRSSAPASPRSQPPPAASGIRMLEPVRDDMLEVVADERPTQPKIPKAPAVPFMDPDDIEVVPASAPIGFEPKASVTAAIIPAPPAPPAPLAAVAASGATAVSALEPIAPAPAISAEPAVSAAVAPVPSEPPPRLHPRRRTVVALSAVAIAALAMIGFAAWSDAPAQRPVPVAAPAAKPMPIERRAPEPEEPEPAASALAPAGQVEPAPATELAPSKRRKAASHKVSAARPTLYRPSGL